MFGAALKIHVFISIHLCVFNNFSSHLFIYAFWCVFPSNFIFVDLWLLAFDVSFTNFLIIQYLLPSIYNSRVHFNSFICIYHFLFASRLDARGKQRRRRGINMTHVRQYLPPGCEVLCASILTRCTSPRFATKRPNGNVDEAGKQESSSELLELYGLFKM